MEGGKWQIVDRQHKKQQKRLLKQHERELQQKQKQKEREERQKELQKMFAPKVDQNTVYSTFTEVEETEQGEEKDKQKTSTDVRKKKKAASKKPPVSQATKGIEIARLR
jgi:hypothetical protein